MNATASPGSKYANWPLLSPPSLYKPSTSTVCSGKVGASGDSVSRISELSRVSGGSRSATANGAGTTTPTPMCSEKFEKDPMRGSLFGSLYSRRASSSLLTHLSSAAKPGDKGDTIRGDGSCEPELAVQEEEEHKMNGGGGSGGGSGGGGGGGNGLNASGISLALMRQTDSIEGSAGSGTASPTGLEAGADCAPLLSRVISS